MAPKLEIKSITRIITVLIVGLVLSPLIISFVSSAQPYSYTTYQTLNSAFSDNTGAIPDNWDNYVENNAVNVWDSDEYIFTIVSDNLDIFENGIWYQSVTVTSIHDGVSSATMTFKHYLVDNDNISAISLEVWLCDGTDNSVIWTDNSVIEDAAYESHSISVLDNVTSTGTYTMYLRTEIKPDSSKDASNIVNRWDDASLTIVTQTRTHTSMMTFAYLIPLFFVIGLVLMVIYWATSRS